MSAKRKSHISSMHLRRFKRYLRTGVESYTVALTYNGITTIGKCWYQFQTMWPKHSTNFNIPPQSVPNMHPTNVRAQIMVQENNSQLPWILHRQSQRNESAVSKKLLQHSSIIPTLWTALFYQPSTHYQSNNQVQLKTWKLQLLISYTMQPPICPRLSNIKQMIWYFTLTVIRHAYQSQGHAAALEGNINSAH